MAYNIDRTVVVYSTINEFYVVKVSKCTHSLGHFLIFFTLIIESEW